MFVPLSMDTDHVNEQVVDYAERLVGTPDAGSLHLPSSLILCTASKMTDGPPSAAVLERMKTSSERHFFLNMGAAECISWVYVRYKSGIHGKMLRTWLCMLLKHYTSKYVNTHWTYVRHKLVIVSTYVFILLFPDRCFSVSLIWHTRII